MKADRRIRKILLVKLSSIGDVVHSLPVLKALRSRYPKAHITWVVKPFCSEIIEGNPYLDEVLIFERQKWSSFKNASSGIRDFRQLIRDVRAKEFDMVVDLQGLFYTGLITFLSGAPIRVGFANAREGSHLFYNHKVKVPTMNLHAVDRYMLVVEALGIEAREKDFSIVTGAQDQRFVEDLLGKIQRRQPRVPIVAINPSARWVTKQWNQEKFAELGDVLYRQWGASIVLIGSHKDVALVEKIRLATCCEPIVMTGKTNLKQLVALLSRVDLLITNDTGPMHIASSVRTPTVALFGPTDPRRTGPYGDGHVVVNKRILCSPCFRKRCSDGMLCMAVLTINDVLNAIRRGIESKCFQKINAAKAQRLAQCSVLWEGTRCPTVDVLILSDGKAGHLNQSLGMVRQIPGLRFRVADVKFVSEYHRALVWAAGICGCGKISFLRRMLTPDSFASLMESAPRVVLSTGTSVAPVNLTLGRIFRAKTAVSMKPGPIPLSRFDLAIIPMHDEPPAMPNVIQTLGAPNLINADLLQREAAKLKQAIDSKKKVRIGVLVGGENKDYYISQSTGAALIGQIDKLCRTLDAEVLWSTSRRTPPFVETMIVDAYQGHPECPLISLASACVENPVPGILGLCDIIVVTEESTSMVSEAANSGKTVVVVRIDRRSGKPLKQERTVQELSKLGYVVVSYPGQLYQTVMDCWPPKGGPKVLDDTRIAADALNGLLHEGTILHRCDEDPVLAQGPGAAIP